jgi:hypothetical protein
MHETDRLALDVAPRHSSVQPPSSGTPHDAPGRGSSLTSHAKEMQGFLTTELRTQQYLDMERIVLEPLLSGGDAVDAVQIALMGSSVACPAARPRALFHQIIHGHIDSVVARPELQDLVRARRLAPVVLARVAGATLVIGGKVQKDNPVAHLPLDTAWKHFKGSAKDELGDAWATLNIEDMVIGPISTAINPLHVHTPVPSKDRYATVDSLATVLEPGAALFTLFGFEDSPQNSWRCAVSEAKRFLGPLKGNRNAGRASRKFIVALLREAYVAYYASRYSSDVRKHPPRQFIQKGSPAVAKFAQVQKVFLQECQTAQQTHTVYGAADSDEEGAAPSQLAGAPQGLLHTRESYDWASGRARSPAPDRSALRAVERVVERGQVLRRTDTGEEWDLKAASAGLRGLGAPDCLCVRWALLRTMEGLSDVDRCPYLDTPTHLHRAVAGFRSAAYRLDDAGANAERNRDVCGPKPTHRDRSPARVGDAAERGRSPGRRSDGGRDASRSRSRSNERRSRSPGRSSSAPSAATATPPAAKPATRAARLQR